MSFREPQLLSWRLDSSYASLGRKSRRDIASRLREREGFIREPKSCRYCLSCLLLIVLVLRSRFFFTPASERRESAGQKKREKTRPKKKSLWQGIKTLMARRRDDDDEAVVLVPLRVPEWSRTQWGGVQRSVCGFRVLQQRSDSSEDLLCLFSPVDESTLEALVTFEGVREARILEGACVAVVLTFDDLSQREKLRAYSSTILVDAAQKCVVSVDASGLLFDEIPSNAMGPELPLCTVCSDRIDRKQRFALSWSGHTPKEDCSACSALDASPLRCADCGDQAALWVCLICGSVGCGRYSNEHAKRHASSTGHALSIQVSTGRVWDYSSDAYVHKVRGDPSEVAVSRRSKFVALVARYERVLESQLSQQRDHYESLLAKKHKKKSPNLEAKALDASEADLAALAAMARDLDDVKAKARRRNQAALNDAEHLKSLCLSTTNQVDTTKAAVAERVTTLKNQIRDLDFYLSSVSPSGGTSSSSS